MKVFHAAHQLAICVISARAQLITVGRFSVPLSSVLIVFVTRSGIDASRLLPRLLSLMNSDMILRPWMLSSQYFSVSSIPLHPSAVISALSSANISFVKTSDTGTSAAPGLSTKPSTACISSSYSLESG